MSSPLTCPLQAKSYCGLAYDEEFPPPNTPSRCTWHLGARPEESVHHHVKPEKRPKILRSVLDLIGNTPLVRLNKLPAEYGVKCEVLAKCEFMNPGGSVKDRIGLRMVEEAERAGKLNGDSILIEPSAGNTGIGIALIAAVKGYRCIIALPEKMSEEKASVLRSLGAEVMRTKNCELDSPDSDFAVARNLCRETPGSTILDQYRNAGNPLAHYDLTAEEILEACDGKVDMIVASAGTGGTVTGIGRKMKSKCPTCKIVGVDPCGSVLAQPDSLNVWDKNYWEVEGTGYDFVSTVLDRSVVDEWIKTTDKESFLMAREVICKEGLLCGGSSGSAVSAALRVAKGLREDQRCVVILPDGVRNYLTKFLNDSWLISRDFLDVPPEVANKYWWWDLKVGCLNLQPPLVLSEDVLCLEATRIMTERGCDQVAVVDENKEVQGIATLEGMMDKILFGVITDSTSVSDVVKIKYITVTLDTNLGKLSHVLNRESFALVVKEQESSGSKETAKEKGRDLVGIATRNIFLSYITNENSSPASSP